MSRLNDLRQFDSSQWRNLDNLIERLEQALERAEGVDLNDLLPPRGAPFRMAYLLELVRTEISLRFRQGRGVLLEKYLAKYPELGPKELVPVSLIYEEYRARQLNGECPPLSVYKERFPERYPQLLLLIDDQPVPRPGGRETTGDASTPRATPRLDIDKTPGPDSRFDSVHAARNPAATSGLEGVVKPSANATPPNAGPRPSGTIVQSASPSRTHNYLPAIKLGEEGYELLPPALGKGEFGEVFKAVAPGGVLVAVKRLFRPLDHSSTQADLLALEKISRLNHPYLLQTHCYGQAEERLVIVMELADGSLNDRLKFHKEEGRKGIPVEELIPYFTQAAQGLDYLHGEKLMHRDIKPQNLLHLKGFAKVADFGLARTQNSDVSRVTMMGGTPMYMPPEAWNQLSSIHSDQYSLAATYVEMRLGRPLFQCGNPFELIRMHTMETPKLEPLPVAEQRVLLKALAKEPDERYPSCVAFVEDLARAIAPPPPPPPPGPGAGRTLIVLLACTLIMALVALGGVGWVLTRTGEPSKPLPVPPPVPPKVVDWQPAGWQPVVPVAGGEPELVKDWQGKTCYKRLERDLHGQRLEVVAIPQEEPSDPRTFYMMTNKVWNALFTAFADGEKAECDRLFQKYGEQRPGCDRLIQRQWHEGGKNAETGKDLGTGPNTEKWPVLRVTVTEAHCFAEFLGGKLPSRTQWLKAAGALDKYRDRPGPFDGDPEDPKGMAILSPKPWPVDEGDRDVSPKGCRQMASNGREWTRSEIKDNKEIDLIPLDSLLSQARAIFMGQSYREEKPLTFKEMLKKPLMEAVDQAQPDIGFRIVLSQRD